MASRFPHSRQDRNNLFSGYDAGTSRAASSSPAPRQSSAANPYSSYAPNPYSSVAPARPLSAQSYKSQAPPGSFASAYPNASHATADTSFRAATPNSRGQYSDAVLSSLESQNDEALEGMSAKVRMLKDITVAIGSEIRDSTALAEKMNDQFEGTRTRLKGTMKRMLRMAEKTGVGWRVWLGFFAFVIGLFVWVWLF